MILKCYKTDAEESKKNIQVHMNKSMPNTYELFFKAKIFESFQ